MTDLYRVLGVSRRATESEIKSAYRRLARRYHPDVCSSPDANSRFAKITEAYRVLSDASRRSMYDLGVPLERKTTFYASRSAEVVAYQRKLDHLVDEMLARDRKETAERSHAVTIVVTLFISAFMVAAAKPNIIEEMNKPGKIAIIALFGFALWYLVKNVSVVLTRYTYTVPRHLNSVFKAEAPSDKVVSRTAALVFLISGYLVSLGLGYLLHTLVAGHDRAPGTVLGVFLYPPIAVLIISSFRRMGGFLDKS